MQHNLWLKDKGWYAEYKDLLGLKQVHPSAALWTVYHAIDEVQLHRSNNTSCCAMLIITFPHTG